MRLLGDLEGMHLRSTSGAVVLAWRSGTQTPRCIFDPAAPAAAAGAGGLASGTAAHNPARGGCVPRTTRFAAPISPAARLIALFVSFGLALLTHMPCTFWLHQWQEMRTEPLLLQSVFFFAAHTSLHNPRNTTTQPHSSFCRSHAATRNRKKQQKSTAANHRVLVLLCV
eukprot:TRINITY_DN668_c1_g1_i8.p1 TRINITY_DN668_c1_g1~~TRINITY_DN668_c1_g1_i8.p1  ORF type:complete len:169 (+),score=44.02 TRINITY_DN668_c1_g1_i8:158-664(+)